MRIDLYFLPLALLCDFVCLLSSDRQSKNFVKINGCHPKLTLSITHTHTQQCEQQEEGGARPARSATASTTRLCDDGANNPESSSGMGGWLRGFPVGWPIGRRGSISRQSSFQLNGGGGTRSNRRNEEQLEQERLQGWSRTDVTNGSHHDTFLSTRTVPAPYIARRKNVSVRA